MILKFWEISLTVTICAIWYIGVGLFPDLRLEYLSTVIFLLLLLVSAIFRDRGYIYCKVGVAVVALMAIFDALGLQSQILYLGNIALTFLLVGGISMFVLPNKKQL